MDLASVEALVGPIPNMTLERAEVLRGLLGSAQAPRILELGFAHGVGTCFLAAMAGPDGRVTAIDLEVARDRNPRAQDLLERLGLSDRVELHYERTSYTWRLMRMLEDGEGPRFDLVYLDGAHDWTHDGLAFFLADKLLRPGGWIALDDLDWTFARSSVSDEPWVQALGGDERTEPHVRKVWELLVQTHPDYGRFEEQGDLGVAQKMADSAARSPREVIVRPSLRRLVGMFVSAVRRRIPSLRAFVVPSRRAH